MSSKITTFKLVWLKIVVNFLRYTYGVFFYFSRKPSFKGREVFKKIKPPYLILGNHVTENDPQMVSYGCPSPVHWVAGNAIFRTRRGRFVMRLLQSISKTKNMSDIETIKIMREYVRRNEVVGLFPEGTQNWDGLTCPIFPSTAKLLKFLKVPVIAAVSKGAFLSFPRWSWQRKKTRTLVEYSLLFTPQQIKEKSADELYFEMVKALKHDEYAYQKKVRSPIRSNRRAESLELVLYTCPECKNMDTMSSQGNELGCKKCGFSLTVDQLGFFSYPEKEGQKFSSIREWDDWQLELIDEIISSTKGEVLLLERGVMIKKQRIKGPIKPFAAGKIKLTREEFIVESEETPLSFSLDKIRGVNIFKQQQLEFFYEKELYQLNFKDRHVSAYKWLCFFQEIEKQKGISPQS